MGGWVGMSSRMRQPMGSSDRRPRSDEGNVLIRKLTTEERKKQLNIVLKIQLGSLPETEAPPLSCAIGPRPHCRSGTQRAAPATPGQWRLCSVLCPSQHTSDARVVLYLLNIRLSSAGLVAEVTDDSEIRLFLLFYFIFIRRSQAH